MIGSLSSARSRTTVAAVYNNSMIIIGGCTKANTAAIAELSSVTIVELRQVELLHRLSTKSGAVAITS